MIPSMLEADNFSSLSVLHLSSASHLLPSSCSPDKDLLLVISRLGIKDTISLWKLQGGKKWEVDVSIGNAAHEEVTGVAWSPDGMSILIAHHPPRLSIHSIQDGRQERSVSFSSFSSSESSTDFRITGVWWYKHQNPPNKAPEMPDFFKRNKTIPGSALSQLKMQPLLDPLKDDTQPITTSDLFSFQGSLPTSTTKAPKLPDCIANWPALPADLVAASIKPFPRPGDPQRRPGGPPEEVLDDVRPENSLNYDSLVIASDNQCRCHFFMDATFPLGHLRISQAVDGGVTCQVASLMNLPFRSTILAHITYRVHEQGHTNLVPVSADLTPLRAPQAREVAKASSAARELAWYMLRVVEEMRIAWVGSHEQGEGAQSLGPKWVKELEAKQKAHSADKEPNAFADLTALLVTGRASEALNDVLGGLSERGLSKWDTVMTDAFVKLRDFAEKRIALASQRLYIILQEVKGWAKLPLKFAVYQFDETLVDHCLALVNKTIVLSAWLASTAREQLWRFKEFKLWLQYESNRVHTDDGKIRVLSWDILEVNRYLMDGLNGCDLDKWFDGEGENRVPTTTPGDIRAPPVRKTLAEVMEEAKKALDEPRQPPWEPAKQHADITHLDRNIEQLVKEIAKMCQSVFANAGTSVGQTATVQRQWTAPSSKGKEKEMETFRMRERTTIQDGVATQYALISVPRRGERLGHLCLSRMQFGVEPRVGDPTCLQVAVISCRIEEGNEAIAVDVLDFEFFDEELIVLVLKPMDGETRGPVFVGTVGYRDLEFTQIDAGPKIWEVSREKLVHDVMLGGEESTNPLRLTGSRKLRLRGTGSASVSVNGRVGRRTVCVLDGKGIEVEVLDMDEEEE